MRLLRPRFVCLALLTVSSALPTLARGQAREPFPGMDAYIDAALKAWKVPGLGLAIVRNDSVIYARGYGVRDVGKPDPVTAQTIFAIGSSSKAFTSAAVAMMVDEKKVALDGTVTTYLPGFQMFDPYVTKELTVRDLLSHRGGLARGELVWYGSGYDRDEIVRRVRYLEPTWSFRSQFGYQNIMYIAAGQVAARATGRSWDDIIKDRLFVPLGMTSSSTSIRGLPTGGDVAQPHAEVQDVVRTVPWRNIDNAGPAGSINAPVADMAQWVRLQLGRGTFGGKSLIAARTFDEMHTPHTLIRVDSASRASNPYTNFQSYGLGWFLQDYRGRKIVHHGGNVDGFTALVAMMPDEKYGFVLLANMNGTGLPNALMLRLFDYQLKAAPVDWSGQAVARLAQARTRGLAAQARADSQRVVGTKPSLPLSGYVGTYADSLYGELTIKQNGDKLQLAFGPNWNGTLEHYHFDSFRVKFDTPVLPAVPVTFRLNAAGKVEDVLLDMAGPARFRKRAEGGAR